MPSPVGQREFGYDGQVVIKFKHMISVNRLKAMTNSGNESMRDERGLGFFNVTEKSPQSICRLESWAGGKGVKRD